MRSARILHSIVTRDLRCFVGGLIGFLFALVMVRRLGDGADGPRVGVPSITGYFGRVDSGLVVRAPSADGVLRESWLSDYFEVVRDMVGDVFPPLIDRCFPLVSSSLIHRDAYEAAGGVDSSFFYSQGYDLWLRLAARYPAAVMGERLIQCFSSSGQLSRRIEERRRDDLVLMRRITHGELRRDSRLERKAAQRAAALEFDLGVMCLCSGRCREGRLRLMRAAASVGPVRRRALSLVGALAPGWSLPRLIHSEWLKGAVDRARRRGGLLVVDSERGGSG